MDRGQHESALTAAVLLPQQLLQIIEALQQIPGTLLLPGQHPENRQLLPLQVVLVEVFIVPHIHEDPGQGVLRRVPGKRLHFPAKRLQILLRINRQLHHPRRLQHRYLMKLRQLAKLLCILFLHIELELTVDAQKQLRVRRIQGKLNDVPDVRHQAVRKEAEIRVFHPVGNAAALQEINERQRTFMVPVQHRRGGQGLLGLRLRPLPCPLFTVLRHLQEIGILGVPGTQGDHADISRALPHRPHVLRVTQGVFLDETVRRLHNGRLRPVIFLHQENPGAGMGLLKGQQSLREGRPEAVDALVLISHHKEIFRPPGQQGNDGVLNP